MIKLHELRITEGHPSVSKRWIIEARLVEETKGIVTYDKSAALICEYLASGLRRMENKITEIMCND